MLKKGDWIKTTCPYCGVGCGVEAKVLVNGSVVIRGDESHPANYGRLCSKGTALADTLSNKSRLRHPLVNGKQVNWNQAIRAVAQGLSATMTEYGSDSIACYVSGQLLTEDYYVVNKLMKGFVATANIDTNSRLCMASSVVGHMRAFGGDIVPNCYADIEAAELVVLVGSNTAWCHPVLFQRLNETKLNNPAMKVVVIDPRSTTTSSISDLHLSIAPGTDVLLFNGLLAYLAQSKALDLHYIKQYTEGFDKALHAAEVECSNFAKLVKQLNVVDKELKCFFQWFAATDKTVTLFSQGVNQSSQGVDKVNSILNCHLATGRIGRVGSGPFSLTGQPNAMGGREVGGMASALACHMEIENPTHREILKQFWNTETVANTPGLKAIDLFEAIYQGDVRAIWIMGTNPAVSLPDSNKVRQALQKCPLVIVSDCYQNTDTLQYADIILPAQGWSEKTGTVTNSERCISLQRAFLPALGEAKPDWWIITEVAKAMGFQNAFNYQQVADIFIEYATLSGYQNSGERAFDISGFEQLNHAEYYAMKPIQWPVIKSDFSNKVSEDDSDKENRKRFFAQGGFFTKNNKANFIAVRYIPPKTKANQKFPYLLNTGRIRDHWHTMTRTGLSAKLSGHQPEPYLQINTIDANKLRLQTGDIAEVNSALGTILVRVLTSDKQPGNQVFLPIHWSNETAGANVVSKLIMSYRDPISGQPEFKYTPVSIMPWSYFSEACILLDKPIVNNRYKYWTQQKVAGGYLYRLASQLQPDQLWQRLKVDHPELFTNFSGQQISYTNTDKKCYRSAVIKSEYICACIMVAGKLSTEETSWLSGLLTTHCDYQLQWSLLRGLPYEMLSCGMIICACKQVSRKELEKKITERSIKTISQLGEVTDAGMGCGSCIPELEEIIQLQSYGGS